MNELLLDLDFSFLFFYFDHLFELAYFHWLFFLFGLLLCPDFLSYLLKVFFLFWIHILYHSSILLLIQTLNKLYKLLMVLIMRSRLYPSRFRSLRSLSLRFFTNFTITLLLFPLFLHHFLSNFLKQHTFLIIHPSNHGLYLFLSHFLYEQQELFLSIHLIRLILLFLISFLLCNFFFYRFWVIFHH